MPEFKFSIDSPRNISFKYKETFTLEDLGVDEETWKRMDAEERQRELDDYCRDLILGKYIEWSVEETEG